MGKIKRDKPNQGSWYNKGAKQQTRDRDEIIKNAKARLQHRKERNDSSYLIANNAGVREGHEAPNKYVLSDSASHTENNGFGKHHDMKGKGGLGVELHPLLRDMAAVPKISKDANPVRRPVRDLFDPSSINPYLNQDDAAKSMERKPRRLKFSRQGQYVEQAENWRNKIQQDELKKKKLDEIKEKGLLPDENIGEDLYRLIQPPLVEWWDSCYLKTRTYDGIKDETNLNYENEKSPVTLYIQHPVLESCPWEKSVPAEQPMFLTKKEMKRIRRNNRLQKLKDKQVRVKLGLEPPDPPKVRLSNLMNVLTNEAIKDPTAVEMRVKKEMEERMNTHIKRNEQRKLTKEQRHQKIMLKNEKQLEKGYFTSVYKVESLDNTQNLFKVDINAKQCNLVGICLRNPRFNLVIVEGGGKSIRFYKKLMISRINWLDSDSLASLSHNNSKDFEHQGCRLVWEGELNYLTFKKWSVMYSNNDEEALNILHKFGLENYWREACVL